jgi:hypothetical protein
MMNQSIQVKFGFALAVGLSLLQGSFATEATARDNENDNAKSPVRLLGVGTIDGTAKDLSGLNQQLVPVAGTSSDEVPEGRTFYNDMFGGISALTWTGQGNTYWMLPDRGPLDGAVDWVCRLQKVKIEVDPAGQSPIEIQTIQTVTLTNQAGLPFTGFASAYQATDSRSRRLDPEGIRVGRNGNLFVSDEYGPRLIEFTVEGKFVRELSVDDRYLIDNPGVSKPTENPLNVAGRQTNRGMEGLALSNDGKLLIGLMQSPLLQDSYRSTLDTKPTGLNCRMPVMNQRGECVREYVYQLDNPQNKLNEVLNCGEGRFVVIERDGEAGEAAEFKKLILVSTEDASDSRNQQQLPHFRSPDGIVPVHKEVLIDLLDERWQLAGAQMPEKIEGLAFGPDLDADHRLLLVASDNDFVPEQKTVVYAFAVAKSKLVSGDQKLASANQ